MKTFSFSHKINLVTLVRTVIKTVLIRVTKTASLYLNHSCYPLDIGEASAFKIGFRCCDYIPSNDLSILAIYT